MLYSVLQTLNTTGLVPRERRRSTVWPLEVDIYHLCSSNDYWISWHLSPLGRVNETQLYFQVKQKMFSSNDWLTDTVYTAQGCASEDNSSLFLRSFLYSFGHCFSLFSDLCNLNTCCQMIKQVLSKPPVSQTYLEKKTKVKLLQSVYNTVSLFSLLQRCTEHKPSMTMPSSSRCSSSSLSTSTRPPSMWLSLKEGETGVTQKWWRNERHVVPNKILTVSYFSVWVGLWVTQPTMAPCLGWEMKMWVYNLPVNAKGENIPDPCYCIFILKLLCAISVCFCVSSHCSVVPGAASLNWLSNSSSSWWESNSSTTSRSSLYRMFPV